MEYVYAAMLLHKAGQQVNEEAVSKVLHAAGVKTEPARIKALVSALEGVDIGKAIKEASVMQAAAPASAAPQQEVKAEKAEKKKPEDDKKSEEAAMAGLGALFG